MSIKNWTELKDKVCNILTVIIHNLKTTWVYQNFKTIFYFFGQFTIRCIYIYINFLKGVDNFVIEHKTCWHLVRGAVKPTTTFVLGLGIRIRVTIRVRIKMVGYSKIILRFVPNSGFLGVKICMCFYLNVYPILGHFCPNSHLFQVFSPLSSFFHDNCLPYDCFVPVLVPPSRGVGVWG